MKLIKTAAIALAIVLAAAYLGTLHFSPAPPVKNPRPAGENIICFGDSLTYGTGASQGMDYPSQLSRLIGRPVINAGIPGDTTSAARARLERDVLNRSPRIVMITLGGNDLKNRQDRDQAFRNLRAIITAIQGRGALVIVGGLDVPVWGRGFQEQYRKVSEETGAGRPEGPDGEPGENERRHPPQRRRLRHHGGLLPRGDQAVPLRTGIGSGVSGIGKEREKIPLGPPFIKGDEGGFSCFGIFRCR